VSEQLRKWRLHLLYRKFPNSEKSAVIITSVSKHHIGTVNKVLLSTFDFVRLVSYLFRPSFTLNKEPYVRLLPAVGLRIRCNEVWCHARPSGKAGSCFTDWPTAAHSDKKGPGISCDTEESDNLTDTADWHNDICLREAHKSLANFQTCFPWRIV
jgi:hypothetical protein